MASAEYIAAVTADSPKAFWKMQDASGFPQDSSGNGFHMDTTVSSGTYQQGGPMDDYSIEITRSEGDGYVRNAGQPFSSVTDNFTIEAWIYPLSDAGVAEDWKVIYLGESWVISWRNGRKFELTYAGIADMGNSTATLALNTWHHIVCKRAAGTTYYYYNGAPDSTKGTNTPNAPSTAVALGINALGGPNSSFGGRMAYVTFYETALSNARVLAHYNAGTSSGTSVGWLVA